jgi:hypothetical protein
VDGKRPRVGQFRRPSGHLGGDDQLVTSAAGLQPGADVRLGAALGFAPRRHRVHLGGVDEVDAAVDGKVELGVGVGFAVLLAERHGAQAQAADRDAGSAQNGGLHGSLRCAKTPMV